MLEGERSAVETVVSVIMSVVALEAAVGIVVELETEVKDTGSVTLPVIVYVVVSDIEDKVVGTPTLSVISELPLGLGVSVAVRAWEDSHEEHSSVTVSVSGGI